MKLSRVFLLTTSLILLFVSCREGAQLNEPIGNYLHIAVDLPETEDGESISRVIHPDSNFLTIKLTYKNGDVIEGEADINGESDTDITLEKLPVGLDVQVEVTLGLEDLPLCSSSLEMDINPGGNSTDMTLEYNSYTILGTLVDTEGLAVGGQVLEIDEAATVTTDASGNFSFTVTTEDWEGYTKFYMEDASTDKYEFARNKRTLIENRNSFELIARPEFFVDFTILSDSFPIKGASIGVSNGDGYDYATVTSDANGRLLYGPVDWDHWNEPNPVIVECKGLFVEHTFTTRGAPGAIIGEVTLDPRVVFLSENNNFSSSLIYSVNFETGFSDYIYANTAVGNADAGGTFDMSDMNGNGGKIYTDYQNGFIYFYAQYNYGSRIIKLDGLSSSVLGSVDVSSDIIISGAGSYDYSVQQIVPINNGQSLLIVSTLCAYTINADTLAIENKWTSAELTDQIRLLTGGYEASDGTLYVMGEVMNSGGAVNGVQSIFRLNADSSMTLISGTPSPYNTFSYSSNYDFDGLDFASLLGLYPWTDGVIMSVKTQSAIDAASGGVIIGMDNWTLSGTPVDNSYDYLVPVGILPDNKFYIVSETMSANAEKKIIRMSSPSDSTPDINTFLTNPSGGSNQSLYFFFDASILAF